jgi:hypothetical protein
MRPTARSVTTGRAIRRAVLLAVGLVALVPATAAQAADPAEFPRGWEGYHTYQEMRAEVGKVAAAHPDIVKVSVIGKSYQGRDIVVAKVSDNVGTDEPEPEVLYEGLHHADEHMGLEMTLRILRWLVDGYGTDERITNIVEGREIWIVFAVNPDGATYDIKGGTFHYWRKNRQPNAGTTAIGTDLNRNYPYRWGQKGASANPLAITYRGPRALSAPEAQVMADFLASRVVDGRQQIGAAISFHEAGRLVMWPYGYTYTDIPSDMTRDDHAALVAIGRAMARSNGYRPQQASDLYITSGRFGDFAYGRYRIFHYTFELSTKDYSDDSRIPGETGRNREAVLYLAEQAGCRYAVLGATARQQRCGPYDDDFEVARGWTVDPDGTDTATVGAWQRGDAVGTDASGPKQLGSAPSGIGVLATGLASPGDAASGDVDGGTTTVESPPIRLPASRGMRLAFRYYLAHAADATAADQLRVEVVAGSGAATTVLVETGSADDDDAAWATAAIKLDRWAGSTFRLRFTATDASADSLVEAAVDDVRIYRAGLTTLHVPN